MMPFMPGNRSPSSGGAGTAPSTFPSPSRKRDPWIANPSAIAFSPRPSWSSARIALPGLDDPDAVDVPLRVELDDVDADARLAQRDRAREAADPASDDEDALDARQLNSPVAAFVSSAFSLVISTGGNDSNIECGSPRFL